MMYSFKLTPQYYINRAIKAKSIDEYMEAMTGLSALFRRHYLYNADMYFDWIKKFTNWKV